MPLLPETHWFLQSSSFWDARHALIGQLSSALWLAGYLKRETEMLRPLTYCDPMSRCDNTKTIKPITNKAFVASCGNIITDYKDLYCLFTFRVNITMSAFVIGETTNYKHYSTLLKTHVWFVSNRNVLTGCESEAPDSPCNSLWASQHCRLLSCQVQEIVLRKSCCTHSNICVVLLWNSVVNTT